SQLEKLDSVEVPPSKPSFITADAGPPVCPARHQIGGSMTDMDKELRPWNDRWSCGMANLNDGLHPLHRAGFATPSLFETAPSQNWRRYQDMEVEHGVWKSIKTKRPCRFPPLGV
ncbi:unnamed protein product, partial [Polarella glacialis]